MNFEIANCVLKQKNSSPPPPSSSPQNHHHTISKNIALWDFQINWSGNPIFQTESPLWCCPWCR